MRLSFAKKLLPAKFGQGLILLWPFSETNATRENVVLSYVLTVRLLPKLATYKTALLCCQISRIQYVGTAIAAPKGLPPRS
jgi:hypothetical protein